MNLFEYARNRIKKDFRSKPDYSDEEIQRLEQWELHYIDRYEKESKENLKNAIKCPLQAYWYVQNDGEKILICFGGLAIAFNLIVFLYGYGSTKAPSNELILTSCSLFFGCFTLLSIYFLYRLIRRNIVRHGMFYIFWSLYLLLSIPYIPVVCGYETTTIGDFYEAVEYKEKYYVIISKEPNTISGRTEYTLPALIERHLEYSYTTDEYEDYYGQTYGGRDIYLPTYCISRLYFKNGGYLTFDSSFPERITVIPNLETQVTDTKGNLYYVTLTTNKITK